MNLVWKDLSLTNAQSESMACLARNKNASQTEATRSISMRKFKFKQGRPKRRRPVMISSNSDACDIEDPGFKKGLKSAAQDINSNTNHSNDNELETRLPQLESESNVDDRRSLQLASGI